MAQPTVEGVLKAYQDAMASPATKQSYIDGINSTSVNPMELAAANEQGYANGVAEAVRTGKFARRLRATPKERWTKNAAGEGAARLGSGAKKATEKHRRALSVMLPAAIESSNTAKTMPNNSLDDAAAIVMMNMQKMQAASQQL